MTTLLAKQYDANYNGYRRSPSPQKDLSYALKKLPKILKLRHMSMPGPTGTASTEIRASNPS